MSKKKVKKVKNENIIDINISVYIYMQDTLIVNECVFNTRYINIIKVEVSGISNREVNRFEDRLNNKEITDKIYSRWN